MEEGGRGKAYPRWVAPWCSGGGSPMADGWLSSGSHQEPLWLARLSVIYAGGYRRKLVVLVTIGNFFKLHQPKTKEIAIIIFFLKLCAKDVCPC